MRWIVEVTSIGKNEKETFCVEAESWQKALQQTRALRNDSGPMSGFSIELLDDGCRAVDPMSRLRYDVRRTRDDAPLTVAAAPAAPAAPAPVSASMRSAPPAPVPARPKSNPPPAPAAPTVNAKRVPTKTAMMGSSGAAILQQSSEPAKVAPPPPPAPIVAHAAIPAAPAPSVTAPSSQVIFKREQDATDALPLTYREYVYAVAPGTDDGTAERVLRAQLEQVRASIASAPAGKLVQLAVLDGVTKGKPATPLATLTWKDWRGEALIAWPRHPKPTASQVAAAAPPPPPPSVAPPPPQPLTPTPSQALTPLAAPLAAPFAPPVEAPAPAPAPPPEPVAPPVAAAPAFPAPAMPASFAQTWVEVPQAPAPAAPPRSTRRMHGDELIADLFESMHDLHFLRDAVEGGDFCLTLALEKLPAHAGVVHLYDIDKREFIVTSTRGASTESLLLRRHAESDPLLSAAMRKRRTVVVPDAAQGEAAGLARYSAIGGARSVMIAPVMLSGRFLGAIELVNPLDGSPWTEDDGNALSYIGEQYAEFVAARGIVTDPERITSSTAQAPVKRG